jgi:hypothetical protein
MPRVYRKSLDALPPVAVPDWHLIGRLAELFAPYGTVNYRVTDSRGFRDAQGDVGPLRDAIEAQDETPESINVSVERGFRVLTSSMPPRSCLRFGAARCSAHQARKK